MVIIWWDLTVRGGPLPVSEGQAEDAVGPGLGAEEVLGEKRSEAVGLDRVSHLEGSQLPSAPAPHSAKPGAGRGSAHPSLAP